VVFGVEPEELLAGLRRACPNCVEGEAPGHCLRWAAGGARGAITVPDPAAQLPVGTLQRFLDDYLVAHPQARVDYIHGEEVAVRLAQRPRTVAFLLPALDKGALFPAVIRDGLLPRKTFSLGRANDKRFYLEARKIR
jgi:hypothetical protein